MAPPASVTFSCINVTTRKVGSIFLRGSNPTTPFTYLCTTSSSTPLEDVDFIVGCTSPTARSFQHECFSGFTSILDRPPFKVYYSLFQQFVVDAWASTEGFDLDYLRYNQTKLRADRYTNAYSAIFQNEAPESIGQRVVLPEVQFYWWGSFHAAFISGLYGDCSSLR
jgi:hypothetical protein